MRALVLAEQQHGTLKSGTLPTLQAATEVADTVDVLLTGSQAADAASALAVFAGLSTIHVADSPCYAHSLAENIAPLLVEVGADYDYILAPASTFGKNILPRVAAMLDVMQISDIVKVVGADTFMRPIYAGNAFATFKSSDALKVITVRPTAFEPLLQTGGSAKIQMLTATYEHAGVSFVSAETPELERPELAAARVVVSGGRGLGSKENFTLIENIADKLAGAVGASRAAVDAGFVPNDYQVGQTGKIVAPELYIAVGISGAIQHLAGMKDAKVIVAINKDDQAPIFEIADYGLVGDLFEILPELECLL